MKYRIEITPLLGGYEVVDLSADGSVDHYGTIDKEKGVWVYNPIPENPPPRPVYEAIVRKIVQLGEVDDRLPKATGSNR